MRAMRTLILNQDLKALFQGVAVVAAVGLISGGVMHPNLRGADEAAGPRMQMPAGGIRATLDRSDPGASVYADRTPTYVIGTDWTRPPPEPRLAVAEPEDSGDVVVFSDEAAHDAPQLTRAAWRDEAPPAPVYPSVSGGGRYDAAAEAASPQVDPG